MSLVASSSSTENESYPLLRDAYAIIDGIPRQRFNLDHWRRSGKSPQDCGTIACAAGWLAMHPMMRKKGLRSGGYGQPVFRGDLGIDRNEYDALSKFFSITYDQAKSLFCTRWMTSAYNPPSLRGYSDKELWKYRVRKFLKETKI